MKNIDRVGGRLNSRISLKYNTFYRLPELKGLTVVSVCTRAIVYVGLMVGWKSLLDTVSHMQTSPTAVCFCCAFISQSLQVGVWEKKAPKKKSLIGKQKTKKKRKKEKTKEKKRGETSFRCRPVASLFHCQSADLDLASPLCLFLVLAVCVWACLSLFASWLGGDYSRLLSSSRHFLSLPPWMPNDITTTPSLNF